MTNQEQDLITQTISGLQEENRALRALLQKYVDLDSEEIAEYQNDRFMLYFDKLRMAMINEAKTLGVNPNHNEDEQTA